MPKGPCRILHLIDSAGVYGAERVILNLSRNMMRAGAFQPVIGCIIPQPGVPNDLLAAAQAEGLETLEVPISNGKLWRDLPRMTDRLLDERIDLIHSHGYKPSVYGSVIGKRARIPIMATCHLWFEPSSGPIKMRLMVAIEKRLYRSFPMVVAVSEAICGVLLAHGVPEARTAIVANGVDEPEVLTAAQRSEVRRALGLSDADFVVLNAGRLTRQKAQWLLLEAVAELRDAVDNMRIVIVGEGPLEEELKRRAADLEIADTVAFLGFRDDMPALLQVADVFALPSLDEGMPMALLEAAAASLPVVCTDVGDIGKLIVHERTGLLIPGENARALAAALLRLHRDPGLAKTLAQAARQAMRDRFSSQAMTRRYLEIYGSVLQVAGVGP